jgi:O-antigen ligase
LSKPSEGSNQAAGDVAPGIFPNRKLAEMLCLGTWPILLAYIFFLPFSNLLGNWLSLPRNILLTIIAADLLHRVWLRRWISSPLDYPLWAYGTAMVIASALSVDTQYSLKAFWRTLLPILIIYHSTWHHLKHGRPIRHLAWSVVLAAMFVIILGFVLLDVEGGRIEGIFPVATRYGKYLDLAIPLTFSLLFLEKAWQTKVLLGALAASEIIAMLWNGTRGAFVALSIICLASAVFSRRHWPVLLLCAVIVAGFLSTLPESSVLRQRFTDVVWSPNKLVAEDLALQDRKGYYKTAWAMIKERPVVGWGYGSHIAKYVSESKDEAWFKENDLKPVGWHAHNVLLEILLEGGIVALAAALWIALAVAGAGIKMLRSIPFLQEPLALGFLAGLCALGIHCLIDVPQWSNSLLAAIYIAAVMTQAGEGQRSTRRGGIRQPLTGTIIDGHEG